MTDNNVPAGWYDQPEDPTSQRWWDGQAWTEHTQPKQTAPVAPVQPEAPQYNPVNQNATPTAWTNNPAVAVAPVKSKLPLILIIGGGVLLFLVAAVIGLFLIIGAIGSAATPDVAPTSSSQAPNDEPSEEAPAPPTDDEDSDTGALNATEQSYVDLVSSYIEDLGLAPQSDSDIVAYGYGVCSEIESGMTKDDFYDLVDNSATTDEQANAIGFMFGAGVASFCPEYNDTVRGWVEN